MRDSHDFASFRLKPIDGKFPDYPRILADVDAQVLLVARRQRCESDPPTTVSSATGADVPGADVPGAAALWDSDTDAARGRPLDAPRSVEPAPAEMRTRGSSSTGGPAMVF